MPSTHLAIEPRIMATFHLFTLLPFELRARVWELTVEPRTVEVRVDEGVLFDNKRTIEFKFYWSPTPVPATLHTCREARKQGLYKKALTANVLISYGRTEDRYVWLNLDIDMLSIGPPCLGKWRPVAPIFERLKFERKSPEIPYGYYDFCRLRHFPNLQEVHIVCTDGMEHWYGAMDDPSWPCDKELFLFINSKDGTTMNSIELDQWGARLAREDNPAR
jgi:hypothetical protein